MATARLDLRLDKSIKEKVERASALLGAKNVTSYVVKHIFDSFMNACAKARKPNKALLDAASFTKKQGIK